MTHNLKALGLAAIAALAMSAFVASTVQAQFTASNYPTTGTATSPVGNSVLTIDGTTVECAGHFAGTLNEASSTVTVTPTYSSCKAFGFASATVATNGCTYVFHDVGANTSGRVSVECPAGKSIVITAGACVADIGTQTPSLGTVTYTNEHPNVTVKTGVTGITANVTTDGFLCPFSGTGHKTATAMTGNAVKVVPAPAGRTASVD